jgi:hypothetical protein
VQLFPALALRREEVRRSQNREMLRDGLARHGEAAAKLAEGLAVPRLQPIEQLPPAGIGQGAKKGIVIHARGPQ